MDGSAPVRPGSAPAPLPESLTFEDLKTERRRLVASGAMGKKAFASDISALNSFITTNRLTDGDAFFPLMGVPDADFGASLREYEGRATVSRDTLVGYRSRLRTWNDTARNLRERHAPTELFSDVLAAAIDRYKRMNPGATEMDVARAARIPAPTLHGWRRGKKRPVRTPERVKSMGALERVLDLPPGALASRLMTRRSAPRTRKGLRVLRRADKVGLSNIKLRPQKPPQKLAAFFDRLIAFKSTAVVLFNAAGEALARPRRTWRPNRDGEGLSPTAELYIANALTRVGWMILPATLNGARRYVIENVKKHGRPMSDEEVAEIARHFVGKGLRLEDITPAHLVDPELFGEFIEWRMARNGTMPEDYLRDAVALLEEERGFLTQQVECVWDYPKLGLSPVNLRTSRGKQDYAARRVKWAAVCAQWKKQLLGLLPYATRGRSKRARNRIRSLLEHPEPMKIVNEIIESHASIKPVGRLEKGYSGCVTLALWYRDQLLLRMLAANPLRNKNFRTMRVRKHPTPDDPGNLYRTHDGGWRLRYAPHEFKNERGAAHDEYDVEVPQDLWPLIEIYLEKARPILLNGSRTEAVFVTSNEQPFSRTSLSALICELTGRHLDGLQDVFGFRTHAFRHIVATAWLRAHPEDYRTVAHILHDTLATVLKNYAHDTAGDGLKRYFPWLSRQVKPFAFAEAA
jgi:integrase